MNMEATSVNKGTIVEFLQDNQVVIGWVLEGQDNKLHILNINKRTQKVPLGRILPWIGPLHSEDSSREEILNYLQSHHLRRKDILSQIDPLEVWEITQGEMQEGTIQWFAELIWDDPEPDYIAALGRAMLSYKNHFRFQAPGFIVFDRQTVEQRLAEQEAARKRREFFSEGRRFCKALWIKKCKDPDLVLPEISAETKEQLRGWLLKGVSNPNDQEFQSIWEELKKDLPDKFNLPVILAQAWGLISKHHNYLLDQAEYVWGDSWSENFRDQIENQRSELEKQKKEPEDLSLISIDSSSTKDIDDAFSLSRTSSGFHLRLALACPVLTWKFDSELDQVVAHRCSSLYLPEGNTHMLPEIIGTDLFSLHAQRTKPVLLLDLELDNEGWLKKTGIRLTWTRLEQNLTYAQVERSLQLDEGPEQFVDGLNLARKLRQRRIENGAVIIEQEEPIIRLEDQNGEIVVCLNKGNNYPSAQLIVSEFMILANHALSLWATEKNIPLFYRTQEINLPKEWGAEYTDPVEIFKIMQEMSASKMDVEPKSHASLGLKQYTPVTSPLRRYPDFINLAQVVSYLEKGHPIWNQQELSTKLTFLNSRLQMINQIQRYRSRYWKLLYLQRWCNFATWSAVLVGENNQQVTFSLPSEQILVRAPSSLVENKKVLGKRFQIRLGNIDPLSNEIKVLEAREE